MSIVINSIENNNGKTKINATFKGDFIASRVSKHFKYFLRELNILRKRRKRMSFMIYWREYKCNKIKGS